jgi:hypothetical protein
MLLLFAKHTENFYKHQISIYEVQDALNVICVLRVSYGELTGNFADTVCLKIKTNYIKKLKNMQL